MLIFVSVFSLGTIIFGLGMLRSWKVKNPHNNTYSILIACRNEEANLPDLFAALQNLDYPEHLYEIILVDDASEDNSAELLHEFIQQNEYVHICSLKEKSTEYFGKQAALKLAAEKAGNDFLVFTDADCEPHPAWLKNFDRYIKDDTGLVAGSYIEKDVSCFERFINNTTSAITAATIGLAIPMTASGSNLAIRRTVFEEVGGYESIKHKKSGDDKFLLQLVNRTKWRIVYKHERDVITKSQDDKKKLINRYGRKYSKLRFSSPPILLLSLIALIFYLLYPYQLFSRYQPYLLIYPAALIAFWLINAEVHQFRFGIRDLLLLLIYPYFVIFFGIYGLFGKWSWK